VETERSGSSRETNRFMAKEEDREVVEKRKACELISGMKHFTPGCHFGGVVHVDSL
jgi:hypothetical protein